MKVFLERFSIHSNSKIMDAKILDRIKVTGIITLLSNAEFLTSENYSVKIFLTVPNNEASNNRRTGCCRSHCNSGNFIGKIIYFDIKAGFLKWSLKFLSGLHIVHWTKTPNGN